MLLVRPLVAAWILLSCSAAIFGQAPNRMPSPGNSRPVFHQGSPPPLPLVLLAAQKAVQAELKLDQAQKHRLQVLEAKMRDSMPKHMPQRPGSSGRHDRPEPPRDSPDPGARPEPPPGFSDGEARPEPPRDPSEMSGRLEPPDKGSEVELAQILSEKQLTRLRQIALQLEGPRGLLAPQRAKELELTEEQLEKIKRVSRADEKSLIAILSSEQLAKWKEMTGRPFRGKIAMPSPRAPMGRE